MRILIRVTVTAVLAFALGSVQAAHARVSCSADWTVEGGGVGHTRSDCSAEGLNASHYRRLWARDYHGILEFPPAYAGGVLYTGQDNGMLSAQRVDGTLLWHRWLTVNNAFVHPNPVIETPTAWNGRIYFTTSVQGGVWCVDAATGETIWRRPIGISEAAPIVVPSESGAVLVAIERSGKAIGIDPVTGAVRWRTRVGRRSAAGFSYGNGMIFDADYSGHVYALHPGNGRLMWERTYPDLSDYADIAYSRGKLIVASRLGGVYQLRAASGRLVWYRQLGAGFVYSHPAVTANSVFVSSYDGVFWKLTFATGRVVWSHPVNRAIGGPVVLGSRVYFAEMGNPGRRGRIFAYDTGSMHLAWTFADGKYTAVTPAGNTLVVVGFRTLYGLRPS